MSDAHIADTKPIKVTLEAGKNYFFCCCGLSKQQPYCDGSHKGSPFSPIKFGVDSSKEAFLCQCKHSAKQPFCDGSHNKLKG